MMRQKKQCAKNAYRKIKPNRGAAVKKMSHTKIAVFRGKNIRKVVHGDEWWFSVVDVVEVLTDSVNPRDYWYKMKIRVKDEAGFELSTLCRQLKLEASDGKKYQTDIQVVQPIFPMDLIKIGDQVDQNGIYNGRGLRVMIRETIRAFVPELGHSGCKI